MKRKWLVEYWLIYRKQLILLLTIPSEKKIPYWKKLVRISGNDIEYQETGFCYFRTPSKPMFPKTNIKPVSDCVHQLNITTAYQNLTRRFTFTQLILNLEYLTSRYQTRGIHKKFINPISTFWVKYFIQKPEFMLNIFSLSFKILK